MPTISTTSNTPFIKVNSNIIFDKTMAPTCRVLYVLAIHLLKKPETVISKQYFADQLQVSLKTVSRHLNTLTKRRLASYDPVKKSWFFYDTPQDISTTEVEV